MRHPDNVHRSDRKILMKNCSMSFIVFIYAYLLASYVTFFNARTWNIQRCIEICVLLEVVSLEGKFQKLELKIAPTFLAF